MKSLRKIHKRIQDEWLDNQQIATKFHLNMTVKTEVVKQRWNYIVKQNTSNRPKTKPTTDFMAQLICVISFSSVQFQCLLSTASKSSERSIRALSSFSSLLSVWSALTSTLTSERRLEFPIVRGNVHYSFPSAQRKRVSFCGINTEVRNTSFSLVYTPSTSLKHYIEREGRESVEHIA